jgi:hypothetical protein
MSSTAKQTSWLSDLRCYRAIRKSLAGQHDHIAKAYQHQWPNFIIIGSAKSATTTLATVLSQHPEIQISASMEPKFFGPKLQTWLGMVWAAILRRRTLPPAWGGKHDVQLLLPLLSTHTTTHPPPSRNHSADLSRTSPLATH